MIRTLVLAVAALATLSAQETARQTFRVGAEMVVVDLVATDRNGAFIGDLQPSDIQLTEDGKPRKIEFLRLVRSAERNAAPASAPRAAPGTSRAADTEPAAAAPVSAEGGLVILVDLASMPIDALPHVRTAIHALLKEDLPAGVPIVLATLSQRLKMGAFTADRAVIHAEVDAIPAATKPHLTLMDILEHLQMIADTAGDPIPEALAQGRRLVTENRLRLLAVSESLTLLSRALSARPGRKQVVLYSAGYFVEATEDIIETLGAATGAPKRMQELRSRDRDALTAMQVAIDRANRAQVSFYAVDPRGLFAPAPDATRRISAAMMSRDAARLAATVESRSQEYLRVVSSGTGGQSFVNNNDMARGLRRAWLDASEYYLIGYLPGQERKKGQFHKISVKVARDDTSIRYRQGYYEATDHEIAEADITSALRQPEMFPPRGLRVETAVDGASVKVSALIPPSMIRFTQSGDSHQAAFSVHAVLRDAKSAIVGGKPLFGRDVTINLKPDRFSALTQSDTVQIPTTATAPLPGAYRLTVVVRDSGGWIAAQTIDLTVGQ